MVFQKSPLEDFCDHSSFSQHGAVAVSGLSPSVQVVLGNTISTPVGLTVT